MAYQMPTSLDQVQLPGQIPGVRSGDTRSTTVVSGNFQILRKVGNTFIPNDAEGLRFNLSATGAPAALWDVSMYITGRLVGTANQ